MSRLLPEGDVTASAAEENGRPIFGGHADHAAAIAVAGLQGVGYAILPGNEGAAPLAVEFEPVVEADNLTAFDPPPRQGIFAMGALVLHRHDAAVLATVENDGLAADHAAERR